MKKILVIPNSLKNLGDVLKTDVTGVILPLEHLAVNSNIYFTLDDIKSIINLTSKEVCVSINKIMHHEDLDILESAIVALNKMNISKIFFYDLSIMNICKRLGIKKELVVFQDHLNLSLNSNQFYQKRGVQYAVLSNDITKEEINEIARNIPSMLICYGYLPCFYSRRYLISNYLKHIQKKKESSIYYIKNGEDSYPIVEEEYGTTIYTKEPINLINIIDELDMNYIILNAFHIDENKFLEVLDAFLTNRKDNIEHYQGLLNKKTVYKVEDYEKD